MSSDSPRPRIVHPADLDGFTPDETAMIQRAAASRRFDWLVCADANGADMLELTDELDGWEPADDRAETDDTARRHLPATNLRRGHQ